MRTRPPGRRRCSRRVGRRPSGNVPGLLLPRRAVVARAGTVGSRDLSVGAWASAWALVPPRRSYSQAEQHRRPRRRSLPCGRRGQLPTGHRIRPPLPVRADGAGAALGLEIYRVCPAGRQPRFCSATKGAMRYELTAHLRATAFGQPQPRDCPTPRVAALRDWRQCRPTHAAGAKCRRSARELRGCTSDESDRLRVRGFRAMPNARRAGRDARRTIRAGARRGRRAAEAAQRQ
jgi:hypothetical protein